MELVFDKFDYQGELPRTLKEGEVYSVRMVDESNDVKDVPLFIRKHLVQQEDTFRKFLAGENVTPSKKVRRKLYVTGPPGCGKTVFTTMIAHRYAAGATATTPTQNKRALMILFRELAACQIFIIHGQETEKLRKKVFQKNIVKIVEELLEDQGIPSFDLCILDGVRQSLGECTSLIQVLNAYTGEAERINKVVFTTSLQFDLRGGDMPLGSNRGHEEINFDSFAQDDYLDAVVNKTFLGRLLAAQPDIMDGILHWKREGKPKLQREEEKKSDADTDVSVDAFLADDNNVAATLDYVNHHYYYAGGSARFMFEYTTFELKELLGKWFDKIQKDEWDAFASSTLSPRASIAVNSLMQQFNGVTTAVSKYVLFKAYSKVEGRLVEALRAAAEKFENPLLRGWAFELQQLHTIKTVLENNSLDGSREKSLKSKEGLCFQPVKNGEASFDGNKLSKSHGVELNCGTIIWCMKWNQGCFDVAFFTKNTLLTLQFTVAGVHSLKVHYINALKNAIENSGGLKIKTCIHVGVVGGDDNTLNAFNFLDPEGAGRRAWNLDFTLRTYKASELMAVDGEEQEHLEATHLGDKEVYTNKRAVDAE